VDAIFKSKKKSVHNGPLSQLEAIVDTLLRYIFELREQGIIVNTFVVTLRASFLSPAFREKSSQRTHTSQRPPAEVESEALDYAMHAPHRPRQQSQPAFHPQHGTNAGLFVDEHKANA
jgi:hypothetical protein